MMYGSWDKEHNRQNFLSFWTIFCPFALLPPYGSSKPKFWKNEENPWRYYHFTYVYQKWQSYDVWFLRYGVQQTHFFVILHHFFPFCILNPKNKKFEKMKKTPEDIIILHMCTINDNHMIYGSWDMKHDRQNFLSFWTIFCPFTLLTTRKIKILKNWKQHLEVLSFYMWVP